MSTLRQLTIFTLGFFLIGVGLLGFAVFFAWETHAFVRTSVTARGRVTALEYKEWSTRKGPGGGYVTVFTFTDALGQAYTGRTKSAQNPPTHQVGNEVAVLYPPQSPDEARIKSFRTLWILPSVLAIFGAAFAGVGGYAFATARRTYGDENYDHAA